MNTTSFTGVVDKNDLLYELTWRSVDNTPDSPEKCGPCLIVKHYHNARVWQLVHLMCFTLTATM